MKCDELEEEYLWTNNVKTPSTRMVRAYNADDVDKAIAELKEFAEDACLERDDNQTAIDELREEIESLKESHYAEMVDAGMRERRLTRALWLARTRTARYAKMFWEKNLILNGPIYFTIDCRCYEKGMKEQTLRPSEWAKVWRDVERKCFKKSDEYK